MEKEIQRSAKITVELTRTEALALIKVGETGLAVIEALGLIANTGSTKAALDKIQGRAALSAPPPMADLTIAECVHEGYELSAQCARCKLVRRLDRDQLAAVHAPDTTVLKLWSTGLRCAVCGEASRSLVVAANAPSYRRIVLFGPEP
jgi:hypothetical protein